MSALIVRSNSTGIPSPLRVVILMQENKTPDFYFPTLASWGANIENRGNLLQTPPLPDPPHDRDAWVHYKMGDCSPTTLQIDNDAILPFYSWLAKQFTYCDYHFGLGTNSTPGQMLAVGGQTPTEEPRRRLNYARMGASVTINGVRRNRRRRGWGDLDVVE